MIPRAASGRRVALTLLFLLTAPALAAARAPEFEPGETVEVARVVDAVDVELADGRSLRLAGLGALREGPRAGADRRRLAPLSERARAALEKLVMGQAVELR